MSPLKVGQWFQQANKKSVTDAFHVPFPQRSASMKLQTNNKSVTDAFDVSIEGRTVVPTSQQEIRHQRISCQLSHTFELLHHSKGGSSTANFSILRFGGFGNRWFGGGLFTSHLLNLFNSKNYEINITFTVFHRLMKVTLPYRRFKIPYTCLDKFIITKKKIIAKIAVGDDNRWR